MLVKLGVDWIDEILPKGFPTNTSTLVSGPGGSGKPLIGYSFASGWLKNGGNVVFLLTSTTLEYLRNTMRLLGTDLDDYYGRVFFIELDPMIESIEPVSDTHVRANFVKPDVWDEALSLANIYLSNSPSKLGTMVVGAALNLLFFSPTYGKAIHEKIKGALSVDKTKTYFLTVNTDVFRDMVEELERSADNLMFSRMEKPMRLFLKVERVKGAPFERKEIEVPLSREILEEIRKEAERGKKNLIPAIKRL
ncbi:ATPase domain-containing protein [Thermococcus sp.]|uniref:ATPase domain-containing protein n=1 Tax=Thermococcus sp. TaxID=35749 RepID=UPI0025F5E843|nr:ATPase domain-containing protein [Thermococcus sp.]